MRKVVVAHSHGALLYIHKAAHFVSKEYGHDACHVIVIRCINIEALKPQFNMNIPHETWAKFLLM